MKAFIASPRGPPKVAMVFFDEETERICAELGYEMILPSAALRRASGFQDRHHPARQRGRCGERAEHPDVGGLLGPARAGMHRRGAGYRGGGATASGYSGKTTFFLTGQADWDKNAENIVGQQQKIMKRINNKAAAVEVPYRAMRSGSAVSQ